MDGPAPPDSIGGYADPEAVLSTVEDASVSGGDPNTTGRRRFAAAVVSLTMTAVGSVVLSLPQVFAECGAVGGVAALAGFAALTDASLVIIARAARAVDARTYEQTVTRVVGPTGGKTLRICLCVLLFGTLVSLQIIAADLAAPVVESLMYHDSAAGGFWSSRGVINVGVLALVYPLSLLENLSQLAAASSAAFFVMIGVALVLVARFAEAGFPVAADVALVGTDPRAIALALPVSALAYTCHFNVVEIAREMRRPTNEASDVSSDAASSETSARDTLADAPGTDAREDAREIEREEAERSTKTDEAMIRVVVWFAAFPFYAAFATVGYLGFGKGVSGDVLTEWIGDGEMAVAQIAVAAVNVLKYPLMGFALRGVVVAAADDAYARVVGARETRPAEIGDARLTARLLRSPSAAAEDGVDGVLGASSAAGESEREETGARARLLYDSQKGKKSAPPLVRAAALFAAHASVASCAALLRRLALVLDLVGATCGVTVAFIVPGCVLWCSLGNAPRELRADGGGAARLQSRVLAATLVAAGVATSACGVAAVAAEIA